MALANDAPIRAARPRKIPEPRSLELFMTISPASGRSPFNQHFERYPNDVQERLEGLAEKLGGFAGKLSIEFQGNRNRIQINVQSANDYREAVVRLVKAGVREVSVSATTKAYSLGAYEVVIVKPAGVSDIK